MDVLDYKYEEHCFIQIDILRNILLKKYARSGNERCAKHRLFKYNNYEYVDPHFRRPLEESLLYTLKSLGEQIKQHMVDPESLVDQLMVVDRRNPKNFVFDENGVICIKPKKEVKYSQLSKSKKALLLTIVAQAIKLIETNTFMTKRELWYRDQEFCRVELKPSSAYSQQDVIRYSIGKLEQALDDLCCLLGCSRVNLHIMSQAKGLVYGNLKFRLRTGEWFDCLSNKCGLTVPTPQVPIKELETDAKFILLVEKDAIFQKILTYEETHNFIETYKVIMYTAKGYPDLNSRAFIHYLWTKLKIPILAIADADPFGVEIVCSYKFGCYTTAHENAFAAVPQIKWLGLLPSDILKLSIPANRTMTLSHYDSRKLDSLLIRPYITTRPEWLRQLELMRAMRKKAEFESLDPEYMILTYLPNKLRYGCWL